MNEVTGQSLVVTKKEFGEHYVVLLFPRIRIDDARETVSPPYSTATKAEAYALDWMGKHPNGTESAVEHTSEAGDGNEQERQTHWEINR